MRTFGPLTGCPTVLMLLVREAYRSLYFYDARTASDVIVALGDLREPPLSAHALVLSVLTILPNFSYGNHVARLFHGLSELRVRHTMLTAHVLKYYLRCCFMNRHAAAPLVSITFSHVEGSAKRQAYFFSSLCVILRTVERCYPTNLLDTFFDSFEGVLRGDFAVSSPYEERLYHKKIGIVDEEEEAHTEVNDGAEDIVENIFFVMRQFIHTRRRNASRRSLEHVDTFLSSLTDKLCFHHLISLVCLMEGVEGEKRYNWRGYNSQREGGMSQFHRQILSGLVCGFHVEELRLRALSKNTILTLLRHLNLHDFSELAHDIQKGLYSLASALCELFENMPLPLDVIRLLVEDDLLLLGEVTDRENGISVDGMLLKRKPRLKSVLDELQHILHEKERRHASKEDDWLVAETLVRLCYHLLLRVLNETHTETGVTTNLLWAGRLACEALKKLECQIENGNPSVLLRILVTSDSVKMMILHQRVSLLEDQLFLRLTEAITRYQINTVFRFCSTNTVNSDVDLQCLYFLLQGRHPTVDLVASVDDALLKICEKGYATFYTLKHIVRVLKILKSKDWVDFSGGDKRWISLLLSVRGFRATNFLRSYVGKSEEVLEMLLSLLVVVFPAEFYSGKGKQNMSCMTTYSSVPHAILPLMNNVLRNCIDCIPKTVYCSNYWDEYTFPTVDLSDVAERCSLRSRSSKLKQMTEFCLDAVWNETGELHYEEETDSLPVKQQKNRLMVVEFALWLSVFRYKIEVNKECAWKLRQSIITVKELRQVHTEVLHSAIHAILSDDDGWKSSSLRQQLLCAFVLDLRCESLYLGEDQELMFIRQKSLLHVVPLLIVELYCATVMNASLSTEDNVGFTLGGGGGDESCFSNDMRPPSDHCHLDVDELVAILDSLMEKLQAGGNNKTSFAFFHDIVWRSLTCIASLSTALEEWVDGFRCSQSFHARSIFNVRTNSHPQHGVSDDVVLASTKNTLLWSLLLLACFLMPHQRDAVGADKSVQAEAAQRAIARLVRLVSYHAPVFRRSRPAPECLLALELREVLEETTDAVACEAKDCVLEVLNDVIRREEEHFSRWEAMFKSVADRMKRYL